MKNGSPFEAALAHQYFSAECFNGAWALVDKPDRSPEDDEAMLLMATASLWHWTQRDDCTEKNRSVGYWQLSRICSMLARGDDAMRHAERALRHAADLPPFYVAYAHEACTAAALRQGDRTVAGRHLAAARAQAKKIVSAKDRAMLESELQSLETLSAALIDAEPSGFPQARLFRVILPASDIESAARFYGELLSQPGERVSKGRHYFDCGGVILACFDPRADGDNFDARPNPDHVYFAVADLDAVYHRAMQLTEMHLEGPIEQQPWGERSFYAKDPFGNPICFVDAKTVFAGT